MEKVVPEDGIAKGAPIATAFTGHACPSEEVFTKAAKTPISGPTIYAPRPKKEVSLGIAGARARVGGHTAGLATAHEACTIVCTDISYRIKQAVKKAVRTVGTRPLVAP